VAASLFVKGLRRHIETIGPGDRPGVARLPQLMDTRKGIYGRDRQVWRGFAELVMIRTRVSTPWAAGVGAASGEFRRG
jgi:hypothetical protein